jgi:hypothetical protein
MSSSCGEINALANPGIVSVGPMRGYATICPANHAMAHHNWWHRCKLSTNASRYQPSQTLIDETTRRVHAVTGISRYCDRGAVALNTDRAAKLTRQTDVWTIAENLWTSTESIEICVATAGPRQVPPRCAGSTYPE